MTRFADTSNMTPPQQGAAGKQHKTKDGTMAPIKTAFLPKPQYRAACLKDAHKCSELSEALDMAAEDGDDVTAYSTAQILAAAREALEFYSSGSIATRVAKGCKTAIRERDELQRFIAKWEAIRAERAAWVAAVRSGK